MSGNSSEAPTLALVTVGVRPLPRLRDHTTASTPKHSAARIMAPPSDMLYDFIGKATCGPEVFCCSGSRRAPSPTIPRS